MVVLYFRGHFRLGLAARTERVLLLLQCCLFPEPCAAVALGGTYNLENTTIGSLAATGTTTVTASTSAIFMGMARPAPRHHYHDQQQQHQHIHNRRFLASVGVWRCFFSFTRAIFAVCVRARLEPYTYKQVSRRTPASSFAVQTWTTK